MAAARAGEWPNRTVQSFATKAERSHLEYCRDRVPFDGKVGADLIEFLGFTWPDVPPVQLLVMESFSSLSDVRGYVAACGGDMGDFSPRMQALLVQMLALPSTLGLGAEDTARIVAAVSCYSSLPVKIPIPVPELSEANHKLVQACSLLSAVQEGAIRWLVDEGFTVDEIAGIVVCRVSGPLSKEMAAVSYVHFLRCDVLALARERGIPFPSIAVSHEMWMTAGEIVDVAECGLPLEYVVSMFGERKPDFERLGIELV